MPPSNGGRLAGLGLRPAILKVLAWHPSGLRPAELAARLEEGGYKPGGRLKTSQLVYGELYRLSEMGKIHKRRKRYVLVMPEAMPNFRRAIGESSPRFSWRQPTGRVRGSTVAMSCLTRSRESPIASPISCSVQPPR